MILNFQNKVIVFFCDFQLRCTLQEWFQTKWLEVNKQNLRTGTAKAVGVSKALLK